MQIWEWRQYPKRQDDPREYVEDYHVWILRLPLQPNQRWVDPNDVQPTIPGIDQSHAWRAQSLLPTFFQLG